MAVLNATPDSFHGPSKITNSRHARERGQQAVADGADILDVGGESSRPGAEPVDPSEEMDRVLPVLEGLTNLPAALSIDARTAKAALRAGASMVNDITALPGDPELAGVVAATGADCVLMHMRGTPKTMQREPVYEDVVDDLCAFFDERIAFAVDAGIPSDKLWLDPGFGFGKTVEHNLTLLRRVGEFKRFGLPILVGTSNKSTIGKVLGGLPPEDRIEGTAATVAVAIWNGADAVRVHDVKAMARVACMTDAILGRGSYD